MFEKLIRCIDASLNKHDSKARLNLNACYQFESKNEAGAYSIQGILWKGSRFIPYLPQIGDYVGLDDSNGIFVIAAIDEKRGFVDVRSECMKSGRMDIPFDHIDPIWNKVPMPADQIKGHPSCGPSRPSTQPDNWYLRCIKSFEDHVTDLSKAPIVGAIYDCNVDNERRSVSIRTLPMLWDLLFFEIWKPQVGDMIVCPTESAVICELDKNQNGRAVAQSENQARFFPLICQNGWRPVCGFAPDAEAINKSGSITHPKDGPLTESEVEAVEKILDTNDLAALEAAFWKSNQDHFKAQGNPPLDENGMPQQKPKPRQPANIVQSDVRREARIEELRDLIRDEENKIVAAQQQMILLNEALAQVIYGKRADRS